MDSSEFGGEYERVESVAAVPPPARSMLLQSVASGGPSKSSQNVCVPASRAQKLPATASVGPPPPPVGPLSAEALTKAVPPHACTTPTATAAGRQARQKSASPRRMAGFIADSPPCARPSGRGWVERLAPI